ncbi:MAG: hypothetical protein AMXMBFR13_14760 [Phycisphaerae bacterium]
MIQLGQMDIVYQVFGGAIRFALGQWWLWAFVAVVVLGKLMLFLLERRRLLRSGIGDIDQMDGLTFEKYLQVLFEKLGYVVERTKYQGDFGADLVVRKDREKTAVQVKRSRQRVGVKAIQEIVAAKGHYRCDRAMVATNSVFTRQARDLARSNQVKLWDRKDLIAALLSIGGVAVDAPSLPTAPHGTAAPPEAPSAPARSSLPAVCATCGQPVSPKVQAYCQERPGRFGGKVYCFEHQRRAVAST